MSEFGVLDCIIRDSGGIPNTLEDKTGFQGEATGDWSNGDFDVLSVSMHDSGILSSNALGAHNDSMMMNAENDELLESMLTGMDGPSMEPFESLGVEVKEVGGGCNEELNLDEFNLELLSPISSCSSDGSSSMADIGFGSQSPMLDTTNILPVEHSELDLIDYLSNDNSDVTLPAVDPRTISPSGNDAFDVAEDLFEQSNQDETENITNKNLFHVNMDNDENTKIQKKMIIKARRNIQPKNMESQQHPQATMLDFPLTATATFLQDVKQSPSTVKLLSHTSQQIKTTAGATRNISIVKNPITVVAPSINTGTTTIYLPVFNSKQQTQKHVFGANKTTSSPTIVVTESNLADHNEHGGVHKRRRISASSSDSGLDDEASITSSGSGSIGEEKQLRYTPNRVVVQTNQEPRRGPSFTTNNKYPRLDLNEEEKRLCENDNIKLPSHYPLTKEEERNLKRIRRKIRNKLSAQDSRKRKKDYLEGIESRAMRHAEENIELHKKLGMLTTQNKTLVGQLRRLHQIIVNRGGLSSSHPVAQAAMGIVGGNNKSGANLNGQNSTALMVLLLSAALFLIPGMREQYESKPALDISQAVKGPPLPGQSRSLLHFTNTHNNNIKEEFTPATNNNANNLKNIKVESDGDDSSSSMADMSAFKAGMPHKSPFGDHDYYAFSDDDGASAVKREPWSPSMSPQQKSYIDADVPPLGYGMIDIYLTFITDT